LPSSKTLNGLNAMDGRTVVKRSFKKSNKESSTSTSSSALRASFTTQSQSPSERRKMFKYQQDSPKNIVIENGWITAGTVEKLVEKLLDPEFGRTHFFM
jgi:hypothetical protein